MFISPQLVTVDEPRALWRGSSDISLVFLNYGELTHPASASKGDQAGSPGGTESTGVKRRRRQYDICLILLCTATSIPTH